jgi:two-component system, NtrC family, response regulator AtoC
MRKRILIVDDEPSIRKVLKAHLGRVGYEVDAAPDGQAAIDQITAVDYHLVVTDLKMPRMGGMELLAWCTDKCPGLPVILITAHGTVDSAVEAIKLGAHDYITKPFDHDELRNIISKALATEEADRRRFRSPADHGRFGIIGQTPEMFAVFDLIGKVADSPTTVLITGESGTGKELVARALHGRSSRKSAPFIQVNCGAIPENLFESELFGHERGAFTGAVTARPGRFELADGGTLFLDEVGELPRDMQVKLLRALQDRTFERVGGVRSHKVDVRLIAATNRNLERDVRSGAFREDLFYRLNVVPIHLPSLRSRPDDIPLLVDHFIDRFNERLGRTIAGVTPQAMAALMAWRWPGNVRELENLVERAVLLSESERIGLSDLPGLEGARDTVAQDTNVEELGLKEYVRVYTAQLERARIQRVLHAENGNVTRASRRLAISRKSLQMKMKEYGLRDEADQVRNRRSDP